jgi:hypothetical protein
LGEWSSCYWGRQWGSAWVSGHPATGEGSGAVLGCLLVRASCDSMQNHSIAITPLNTVGWLLAD